MRILRIVRNVAIAIVVVLLLCIGLVFYSFSKNMPLADMQPVSGGAVVVKDGMVSVGLIPAGNGQVILVDCGNDASARAILADLGKVGLGPEAVKTILITHGHPDHVAGCSHFSQAGFFAMAPEQGLIDGREAARSVVGHLFGKRKTGLRIARYLQDGESLQCGNVTVTAYLIPGHTDGSAAYLVAGTLYLGDSADSTKEGRLVGARRIVSNDVDQSHASLRRLAERLKPQSQDIQFLEFGHSAPLKGLAPLEQFANSQHDGR
jgi:hydroxyacylglutathione hydrolase